MVNQSNTILHRLFWLHAESPLSAGSGDHRKYRVDSQQQGGVGLLYDDMSTVLWWLLYLWRLVPIQFCFKTLQLSLFSVNSGQGVLCFGCGISSGEMSSYGVREENHIEGRSCVTSLSVIKARPPPEDSREENETLTKLNCELCALTGLSPHCSREELSWGAFVKIWNNILISWIYYTHCTSSALNKGRWSRQVSLHNSCWYSSVFVEYINM